MDDTKFTYAMRDICVPPCNYLRGHSVRCGEYTVTCENCQTQQRLNNYVILAVHKDIVCEMEMEKLMDEFVDATPQRRNMFSPPP